MYLRVDPNLIYLLGPPNQFSVLTVTLSGKMKVFRFYIGTLEIYTANAGGRYLGSVAQIKEIYVRKPQNFPVLFLQLGYLPCCVDNRFSLLLFTYLYNGGVFINKGEILLHG